MGNGDNDGAAAASNDFQQFGMAYNLLFSLARDKFLATNESAFRSLQVEFKDSWSFPFNTIQWGGRGNCLDSFTER
jgi:hypothetical protein